MELRKEIKIGVMHRNRMKHTKNWERKIKRVGMTEVMYKMYRCTELRREIKKEIVNRSYITHSINKGK
jgi:hypothetical protein